MDLLLKTKYELQLDIINDNALSDIKLIKADSLVELQSKFTLVLLEIQKKQFDDIIKILRKDDDIPF